jgi:hypothetical protein
VSSSGSHVGTGFFRAEARELKGVHSVGFRANEIFFREATCAKRIDPRDAEPLLR